MSKFIYRLRPPSRRAVAKATLLRNAGARLARTGSIQSLVNFLSRQPLRSRERQYVVDGYNEESAQIDMLGLAQRHGRPYGRF